MDLGSINEKLLQNVQRTQSEQIALISKSLALKTGSHFIAQAQQVTQATPDERAEIIKSIDATLAQLNKNSAAPATKALISQLIEQKNLLQNQSVRLVSLNANPQSLIGSSTTVPRPLQPLLTYTDQPIHTGQTLLLQLTEGSRLKILQPLTQTQLTSLIQTLQAKGIDFAHHTSTAQIAKFDLSKLLEQQHTQQPQKNNAINETARTAISESLRALLPKKDSGQDLLASLPKIAQFLQTIPAAQRKEWLPNQIQDALKTVANQIRVSDQLTNPKLLAMSLNNNGQSFEHKLAQLIPSSPAPTGAMPATTTTGVTRTLNPATAMNAENAMNIAKVKSQTVPVDRIAAQDLKGALLGLLHQLDTEVSKTPATLLSGDLGKNLFASALPQFLGLIMNRQQGELTQKQLRTQLIQLMHQYTLGSLAKIQLQQIHSVSQQLTQVDVTQPNQSWQFEIPVRQGQEVHPLQIHMEQQWIEEEYKDERKTPNRIRQWNVMLNFDLPEVGKFYAQLGISGENLTAKFWAEHESTLLEAKQKIELLTQQLEKEGIKVTHMQCIPGLPPKPKMLLSYSLVDVKT